LASQSRNRWLLAGAALGIAIAAALGALWAFRYGLDRYRERIERMVAQSTGRPFHLQGPLELRLAPLTIETGPAQLGNPPGVTGPPFAAWRSTRVALELMPLLHRRLVVDNVRLEGLEMHLQRTADGRANWSGWSTAEGRERPTQGGDSLPIELRALEIRGGEIDLTDAGTERRAQLSDLNLNADSVRFGPRIEIGSVRLSSRVWTPSLRTGSPIQLDLAKIDLSQTPHEVSVSHASLRFAESSAEGSLTATESDGLWHARGALSARVASVRRLAEVFGVHVPRTRDPEALGSFALMSDWAFEGGTLELDSLNAHLDDTAISGRIVYRRVPSVPLLEIDLHGDRVNLDRYSSAQANLSGRSEMTLAELRALPIQGTLALDEMQLGGTEMHQIRLEMGSLERVGLSGRRAP